jgi:hypothetical protein
VYTRYGRRPQASASVTKSAGVTGDRLRAAWANPKVRAVAKMTGGAGMAYAVSRAGASQAVNRAVFATAGAISTKSVVRARRRR